MTITDSADIRFDCTHCGQPFVVEASGAGLETSCPICDSRVVVPHLGTFDHRDYGHGAAEKNRLGGARAQRAEFANPDATGMREELIDASMRTGRAERELDEAHAETAALRHQSKADRAQLKAELAAVKQRLATTDAQLAESRARAADLQSGLALANEELSSTLDALGQRTAGIEAQRQQLSLDLDVAHEKVRAVEAELAIRDREREEARMRVGALEQQFDQAKREISALQDESALYRKNFDEAQARLAETAGIQLELSGTQNELQAAREKLRSAEAGCKSLSICCEELRKETQSLRSDLVGSKNGRELIELRTRFQATQEEHQLASRKLAQAGQELHRLAASESQLRSELDEACRSRAEAERRAEAGSESKLSKDNFVLRGIIDRQNGELTQRLHDLKGLRRAQLGLRLIYALFAVGLLGVVAFAIYAIPLAFK